MWACSLHVNISVHCLCSTVGNTANKQKCTHKYKTRETGETRNGTHTTQILSTRKKMFHGGRWRVRELKRHGGRFETVVWCERALDNKRTSFSIRQEAVWLHLVSSGGGAQRRQKMFKRMIIAVCGSSLTVFMWFMVWGVFSLKVIVGCFWWIYNANTFSAHLVVKKQNKKNPHKWRVYHSGTNRKHKCNSPDFLVLKKQQMIKLANRI